MRKIIIILSYLYFSLSASASNKDSLKVKNIVTFSKSYEMLRYYHPDSDFKSSNWNDFVEMNVDSILQNENIQMRRFLNKSFSFLPMTNFSTTVSERNSNGLNGCNQKYYTNYHGYSEKNSPLYFSERLKTDKSNYLKSVKTSTNIYINFPVFTCNEVNNCVPNIDYQTKTKKTKYLTNLIMINAICNQFYPNKIKLEKINTQFEEYIERILNSDDDDLVFILKNYVALLKDDHVLLRWAKAKKKKKSDLFLFGLDWELTQDSTLKVLQTHSLFKKLKNTEIIAINSVLIKDKVNYYSQVTPSANWHSIIDKMIDNLKVIKDTNDLKVTVINQDGKTETLKISNYLNITDFLSWENENLSSKKEETINDSIKYINLTTNSFKKSLTFLKTNVTKSDYLFLDMRGRPYGGCYDFLASLYTTEVTDSFMNITVKNIESTYFEKSSWEITPSTDNKIEYKKLFILINHKTLSYGESIAYFLSKLPNSYLVGTQSSGCNGSVTSATLDDLTFRFTGMSVDYKNNRTPTALYPDIQYQFEYKKLSKKDFIMIIN